jgi:hypothetical protein
MMARIHQNLPAHSTRMSFILWLQDLSFSTWIRESDWAIFAFLIAHTIAMGFLAGSGMLFALRTLGVAATIPAMAMARLFLFMRWGVGIAIVTGVLLVCGYPAKALTNPLFYLKLLFIVTAWIVTHKAFSLRRKDLAIVTLCLWPCAIAAGKFLAYTNKMLLVY